MIRDVFNGLGCLLAIPNLALDITYIIQSPFYNKSFFVTLIVILLLRIAIIFVTFLSYLCYQLDYKPPMSTT